MLKYIIQYLIKRNYLKVTGKKIDNESLYSFISSDLTNLEKIKLINILKSYKYYSEEKIIKCFKEFLNTLDPDFEEKVNLFVPFRQRKRFESSNLIFPQFIIRKVILKNKTADIITDDLIKDIISWKKWKQDKIIEKQNLLQKIKEIEKIDDISTIEKTLLKKYKKDYKNIKIPKQKDSYINRLKDVENLIIFDDFIGTGKSILKFFNEDNIKKIKELEDLNVQIYFMVLETSKQAVQTIEEFTKTNNINNNFHLYYSSEFNIANSTQHESIRKIENKLKIKRDDYCIDGLVSTFANTPNNTAPLFWKQRKNWLPLFSRIRENDDDLKLHQKELIDRFIILESQDDNKIKSEMNISPSTVKNILYLVSIKEKTKDFTTILANNLNITNYQSQAFINELEKKGYLVFEENWKLTEKSKSIVRRYNLEMSKTYINHINI